MSALDNLRYRLSPLTGEFVSGATEAAFNTDRWPLLARQIRLNSIIGAAGYLTALSIDYLTFGWGRQTLVMAAMRSAVALAATIAFLLSYQGCFSTWIKTLTFVCELLIGVSELIEYRYFFKLTHSFHTLGTPFIAIFILIFYLIVQNRVSLTVIATSIVSLLFIGFHFISLSFSFSSTTIYLGVLLLVVNMFGYSVLLISNRQSRRIFSQRALLEEEIAERKLAEAAASQAKMVAEQANMAKNRFLAVMNHEIRTPLNGILGGLQLLEAMSLDTEQRATLKIISHSATQLAALLEDILDLSNIESGQIKLISKTFNLPGLLHEVKAIMTIQAREKGVCLKLHLDKKLPTLLLGDPIRLRQVLNNLVGNAIKFTEAGDISVVVKRESPKNNPLRLDFSVTDNGIGLSEADQKLIFKPFYQVDKSDTRNHGGSGLGLSISYDLVEAMGGELQVSSKIGGGSRFHFTLEFKLGEGNTTMEMVNDLPQLSLLLVDDTEANLHIAGGLLEKLGQLVTYASSGEQAIRLAAASRFDLIFMDLHMPGINGIDASRRIHAEQPAIPIVAMTADTLKDKIQDCLEKGMVGFIAKPVRREQLLDCLLNMSGQYSIRDEDAAQITGQTAGDEEVYPLLDLELIAEIKKYLSEKKVTEIMTICRQSLHDLINLINYKQGGCGTRPSSETIHRLSGIAGNYGMVRLHQCTKKLVLAIERNDFEQQEILRREVQPLVNESLKKWGHI